MTSSAEVAPIFVVGPPRSGAKVLFDALSHAEGCYFRDDGARDIVDQVGLLHPAARGWHSGRLDAGDAIEASDAIGEQLTAFLLLGARDRNDVDVRTAVGMPPVLDVSARHALRVPFLAEVFPSSRFVLVLRSAGPAVASLAEAWRSARFVPYPGLPGWRGPVPWSYPLIEGWDGLAERAVHELAAVQWQRITDTLLDDLDALDPSRWCATSYEPLIREPRAEVERLCDLLDLSWDRELVAPLPVTSTTLSAPDPDKWRRQDAILRALPSVDRCIERVAGRIGAGPSRPAPSGLPTAESGRVDVPEAGFGSEYTATFPAMLREVGASLLVSTYQSGRVILARVEPEGGLNTHYRAMQMPMGIAISDRRIAIGIKNRVITYANHPKMAEGMPGSHDGYFLPLTSHFTGDIRIHDMAWAGGELWAVSTRFSSLVTFADCSSFDPRWRPSFVSAFTPEDRCHLNGCAVVGDRLKFVTALGHTDTPGGWRDDKAHGGIVIDVESGEVVCRGLSMPHSPRWYDGNLWVLESGKGEIGVIDLMTGQVQTVASLPGFTRGLAFVGPYALVGLSEVRESVFRGLPIAQRQARECGVWIVDIRTGDTVGFLRFTGSVNEIFDVQLLHGYRWPELSEEHTALSDDAFVLS